MALQRFLMLLLAFFSISISSQSDDRLSDISYFQMSTFENRKFFEHTQTRLPQWKKLFKKYSREYQIPWTLLAAVSYQESHWDQEATSYTGVKGLMQITLLTAQHIGIEDREDPRQSIRGGAYYLKYLFNKTPKNISDYERWTQALSAYNMGWAHLRDARRLALLLNTNPNKWREFRKIIPKLQQEKYYSQLSFGPARGRETVDFVDSVIGYYKVLNQTFTLPLLTSRDF